MSYELGFRARMVKRMTGPQSTSVIALARETGVSGATLSRWLKAVPLTLTQGAYR